MIPLLRLKDRKQRNNMLKFCILESTFLYLPNLFKTYFDATEGKREDISITKYRFYLLTFKKAG